VNGPQPVYDEGGIQIYQGDCLQILPHISCTIDAIVTDPPYASGARTEAAKASSGAMLRGQRWNASPIENDQMTTVGFIWLIREVLLAIKPNMVDGSNVLAFIDWRNWPNLVGAIESTNLRVNGMVVWDKQSMGLGNGFRAQHELICHASMGTCDPANKDTANVLQVALEAAASNNVAQIDAALQLLDDHRENLRRQRSAVLDEIDRCGTVIQMRRDSNEYHPSPKPVPLMQKLLRVVCSKGQMVIDPFMGAGSTLVAAKALGLRAIGIESQPEYVKRAIDRLHQNVMDFDA
jgi:site-specific DNA-methyltransferase (adenine-specific)